MSLYPYVYGFPNDLVTGGQYINGERMRVTALHPTIPAKTKVEVTYSEAPITTTRYKRTCYSGDLAPSDAKLSDFITSETAQPSCRVTYDTTAVDGFKKIDCIKDVRRVLGLGLKEAKELVEQYEKVGATIILISHHW